MPQHQVPKQSRSFLFGCRGLTKEDIIKVDSIFKKYAIPMIYSVSEYELEDVHQFLEVCDEKAVSSFLVHRKLTAPGPYLSLLVNNELSSWEVSLPQEKSDVKEIAYYNQLFEEVKAVLRVRQRLMPAPPWRQVRNILVLVPVILLSFKVSFPSLPYGEAYVLYVTLFAALLNYSFALIEIRSILRNAILVRPPFSTRLALWCKKAGTAVVVGIISGAFVEGLKVISKYIAD